MRFHINTTPMLVALPLLVGGVAGCGTETVEPDVIFLSDSNVPVATGDIHLDVVLLPNTPVAEGAQYSVRIDGRRVLASAEDPTPWEVTPGSHAGRRADNLAGGAHVVELLDPRGRVVLTTSALQFTPGRGNQIVAYGAASDLRYHFFDNPAAVSDAVPTGSMLARVLNIRTDGKSVDIGSCALTATSALDCTTATTGLAYGQIWEQVLPRDTALAISPGDIGGLSFSTICSTASGTMVEPKVETFVLAQANGYFDLYDIGGTQTCGKS